MLERWLTLFTAVVVLVGLGQDFSGQLLNKLNHCDPRSVLLICAFFLYFLLLYGCHVLNRCGWHEALRFRGPLVVSEP